MGNCSKCGQPLSGIIVGHEHAAWHETCPDTPIENVEEIDELESILAEYLAWKGEFIPFSKTENYKRFKQKIQTLLTKAQITKLERLQQVCEAEDGEFAFNLANAIEDDIKELQASLTNKGEK